MTGFDKKILHITADQCDKLYSFYYRGSSMKYTRTTTGATARFSLEIDMTGAAGKFSSGI